ncbi:hypothetical protein [Flavobacterium sp.]|uniref:hypothetical protein n=1 Tax=Flavobacterium sp. TaxID=239 RepID=UPI00379F8CF3
MKFNIKEKFDNFLNNSKDYPLLVGFVSGFYPMIFYYSNNFESINSWSHLAFFTLVFLVIPSFGTWFLFKLLDSFQKLKPYKKHLLFISIIEITAIFMSQVYYLTIKKKLLLLLLILILFLSLKFYEFYKKIVVFVVLLSIIPFVKCVNIIVYKQFYDTLSWMKQMDNIERVKFIKTPNIYFLEPDGYASKEAMQNNPYNYKDTIYDWLESNSFTLYKNTRSNYPASLASNASMFALKHHYLKNASYSPFEMQDARRIIVGNNPTIAIFKNNNYKTFFIVEDGYFQQSFQKVNYDYHNIQNYEIPFFSNDNNAKKDVYEDLKKCIESDKEKNIPKFYFIEKLYPHHVDFDGSGKENLRNIYLKRVETANIWIKKTIDLISKKDPSGIIIIAADHGGWVGFENVDQLFAAKDRKLINSIFCNLVAIKWNDDKHINYDKGLKSNVNIFRILFSYLSENKILLKHLQEDSSYNIHQEDLIF